MTPRQEVESSFRGLAKGSPFKKKKVHRGIEYNKRYPGFSVQTSVGVLPNMMGDARSTNVTLMLSCIYGLSSYSVNLFETVRTFYFWGFSFSVSRRHYKIGMIHEMMKWSPTREDSTEPDMTLADISSRPRKLF